MCIMKLSFLCLHLIYPPLPFPSSPLPLPLSSLPLLALLLFPLPPLPSTLPIPPLPSPPLPSPPPLCRSPPSHEVLARTSPTSHYTIRPNMHFPVKFLQHVLCCRSLHGLNLMLCLCVLGLFIFTFHTSQRRSLLAVEGVSDGGRQHQPRQVSKGGVVLRGRDLTAVMQEEEGGRDRESWEGISNNPHFEQRMQVSVSRRGCGAWVRACVRVHVHVECLCMSVCVRIVCLLDT